jgi:Na+-transporting NADH:ubiquinone oxidoreductase subunit C
MSNYIKSLIFSAVLCLVVSLLLTFAATGLKPYQERNIALDKKKNVLKAVGLIVPGQEMSEDGIVELFETKIKPYWVDRYGKIITESEKTAEDLPIYLFMDSGGIHSYILPINARGLWGQIQGYLALKNDGATISGFTVYKHSETPGLGGEIEQRWFQENFVGKKIVNREGGFISISIAKGAVKEKYPEEKWPNYVDGISGATLTGKYLSESLKDILSVYEPVSIKFRRNILSELPGHANPEERKSGGQS